jgi:hypothetical protein
MNQISRNGLFLSDDFIQAWNSVDGLVLSKFRMIQLPEWSESGMLINATDLGLASGITDPNVLLPEVFQKYWFNLMAHARKQAQTYDDTILNHDFAEQAFWKCLVRLGISLETVTSGSMIKAESSDIIVNNASYSGNLYLDILLSEAANTPSSEFASVVSKPSYLSTTGNLPKSSMTQILQGNEKALYDKDLTYYALSDSECLKFTKSSDNTSYAYDYNAILLYYNTGTVEQLAGIFFPNAFTETDGVWSMQSVAKLPDSSYGYSLNIMHTMTSQLSYHVENADTALAMQIYQKAYNTLLNHNLQLSDIATKMHDMQDTITKLEGYVIAGKIDSLIAKLSTIENTLATKYAGHISTDKLLDLFLQVKNSTNALTLYMQMSDLTNAMIPKDIRVTNAQGILSVGSTIKAGTPIYDILADMLSNILTPDYVMPAISISINDATTIWSDYNEPASYAIDQVITQNDAGQITANWLTATTNGVQTNVSNLLYSTAALIDPVIIRANIQFNEGLTKNYSDGNPCLSGKIYAGSIYSELVIRPEFDFGIGSIDLLDDLDNITYQDLSWSSVKTVKTNYTASKPIQIIAWPALSSVPITNLVVATANIAYSGISYKIYAIYDSVMSIKPLQ